MKGFPAVAFLLAWASVARAQQPFYTDDADVTPLGKVHVEIFNEHDWLVYGVAEKNLTQDVTVRVNGGYLFTGNSSTGVVGIRTRAGMYPRAASLESFTMGVPTLSHPRRQACTSNRTLVRSPSPNR